MNPRLLMVDDEPLALRGYQRMLFDLSGQLEMDFADSGTTALARHEAAGFDVIVSDMRMPQMNGLELLQRVAQRSPATARILLTGHSDQNISIRFTGAVQHCLHKPCDSDHLVATVLRLLALQRAWLDPAPAALAEALPPLPDFYHATWLSQKNPTAEESVTALAKEPRAARAAQELARDLPIIDPRATEHLDQLAGELGADNFKALALAAGLLAQMPPAEMGPNGFVAQARQLAIHTGRIAARLGAPLHERQQAALAAFFLKFAEGLLAARRPEGHAAMLETVRTSSARREEAEKCAFGFNEEQFAARLVAEGGLAFPYIEAILLRRHPSESQASAHDPITAVHLALTTNRVFWPEGAYLEKDVDYLARLGLIDAEEKRWSA